MPYPTETKHYSSTYPNAPQVIADPGGYVGFLDAILVTGYGIAVLGDIVVTDGVAVVGVPSGHSLRKWQVAAHAGAGHAGLNGEHRVIAASGNTYTIEVTGVPNGTYSGGSTRVAPLGFEISYQSGHKRIYRSKDSRRNAVSLFVDDSNTVAGWNIGNNKALVRVCMVCDVVDIGSFTTLDTTWWPKSAAVSGTVVRPWLLAGDALGFYTAVDVQSNDMSIASNHFCQLNSLAAGDRYATLLEGATPSSNPTDDTGGLGCSGAAMNAVIAGTRTIARALVQTGVSVPLRYAGLGVMSPVPNTAVPYVWQTSGAAMSAQGGSGAYAGSFAPVNPADSGLVLGRPVLAIHSPLGAVDGGAWTVRAVLPGFASVPSSPGWSMAPALLETPAGWPGACLLGLPAFTNYYYASAGGASVSQKMVGGYYVDVVGAWR